MELNIKQAKAKRKEVTQSRRQWQRDKTQSSSRKLLLLPLLLFALFHPLNPTHGN